MKKHASKIALCALLAGSLLFSIAGCTSAAPSTSTSSSPSTGNTEGQWPQKPIQVIVPAAAGGGTDVSARIVLKYLSQELGQPITVTNIKGAGGSTGIGEAKNADPDGYTMLYTHEDIVTNQVLEISDFGFRDFKPAGTIFDVDLVTVIANKRFTSLADVQKEAEANPGKVTFAIDIATSAHLVPLLMEKQMGIDLKLVDSGSMNDRIPAMMSGQLDLTFAPLGIVKDYVENGDINCIGVLGPERSPLREDIPTFKEQGTDIEVNKFFTLYFPAETPQEIVDTCSAALERVSQNPDFIADAENILYTAQYSSPEETIKTLESVESALMKYKDLMME
ncbi:MAG: tripartite tricarboxylate transporter substrate binding protein [Eubacteriales bacterium]|jgi:tripartite-type tricarboxylate transporter receptor subunit TctC